MSQPEGKQRKRPAGSDKPAKASAPKAPRPVKAARPPKPAKQPKAAAQPGGSSVGSAARSGERSNASMWRAIGYGCMALVAALAAWVLFDLVRGWEPNGLVGIVLRILPILLFAAAASASLMKASSLGAPAPAPAADIAAVIAAEKGAERDSAVVVDRSPTTEILGNGHPPAAPLPHVQPPPPVPQAAPSPVPPPSPNGYSVAPPSMAPNAPILQPGVHAADVVSDPAQGGHPMFDGSASGNGSTNGSFQDAVERSFSPGEVVGPAADARDRHPVHISDTSLVEVYRDWVITQTTGERAFQTLAVYEHFDQWFLLSASGVATLLAWTHEDHGATYSAETWVDQILPMQGIGVADRQLALDLLNAAALHAGGLHTSPTERLMAYQPAELVTAMATLHVGLLRLYSGLEGTDPAKVLRDQLGDVGITQVSLPPLPPPTDEAQARWLPPGS